MQFAIWLYTLAAFLIVCVLALPFLLIGAAVVLGAWIIGSLWATWRARSGAINYRND